MTKFIFLNRTLQKEKNNAISQEVQDTTATVKQTPAANSFVREASPYRVSSYYRFIANSKLVGILWLSEAPKKGGEEEGREYYMLVFGVFVSNYLK